MPSCPECQNDLSAGDILRGSCTHCGCALGSMKEETVRIGRREVMRLDGSEDSTRKQVMECWHDSIRKMPGINSESTLKSARRIYSGVTSSVVKVKQVIGIGGRIEGKPDYELLGVLGEGAMGVVYFAKQNSIDRKVAVKMIKPDAAEDREMRTSFLAEATVIGDLEHPNIVPIYDLGMDNGNLLFYSMKHVRGTPWRTVFGDKTLLENLDILMRVCDAMAFAHSRGVIHRDLKPGNIMLGDFGEVLVMDWGLSASISERGKAEPVPGMAEIGGTPAYMAPEMAMGDMQVISTRSDIYLLGALLYEIVTGQLPHGGDDVNECLLQAAQNIIQPTPMKGELLDIAYKAMSTSPEDRFATVKEFQQAIRDYQDHFESIALAQRAEKDLKRAQEGKNYEGFAQAVFRFREALRLWQGNKAASQAVSRARLAYARCAFEKGDLDLAGSVLRKDDPEHRAMLKEVGTARLTRDARKNKLRDQAAVALSPFVVATVAVLETGLQLEARAGKPYKVTEPMQQGFLSAVIGFFSENMLGSFSINLSKEIAVGLTSRFLMEEVSDFDESVVDAMGEIANMIAGNAIAELPGNKEVHLSLPTLISGNGVALYQFREVHSIAIDLETELGEFSVALNVLQRT